MLLSYCIIIAKLITSYEDIQISISFPCVRLAAFSFVFKLQPAWSWKRKKWFLYIGLNLAEGWKIVVVARTLSCFSSIQILTEWEKIGICEVKGPSPRIAAGFLFKHQVSWFPLLCFGCTLPHFSRVVLQGTTICWFEKSRAGVTHRERKASEETVFIQNGQLWPNIIPM